MASYLLMIFLGSLMFETVIEKIHGMKLQIDRLF